MLEKSKIHLVSFLLLLRSNEPMYFFKAPSAKNWHKKKYTCYFQKELMDCNNLPDWFSCCNVNFLQI